MPRRRSLILTAAALAVVIAVAGAIYVAEERTVDRFEDQYLAARNDVDALRQQLGERDGEIAALREQIAGLEDDLAVSNALIAERERTIGELEATLGQSGDVVERYADLLSQYTSLQESHQRLLETHETLTQRVSSLVPIRSPEIGGDALLLDRSVQGVTYTGAVCSGSMEPGITCEDLLVLYKPNITDLDVGDVIYFKRPNPDCTGALDGRYLLHRITRVFARSDGIYFETKGDALSRPDPCLVPASYVEYKLLTTVRNARIPDTSWAVTNGATGQ